MSTDTQTGEMMTTGRSNGGLSLGVGGVYDSFDGFQSAWRMANSLAVSSMVPDTYQNNPANCLLALDIAARLHCGPFLVMQNLYLIHGRPSWSAPFVIASVEASGKFGPLRYQWRDDAERGGQGCRAVAKDLRSGEDLEGTWITDAMVKAEGWQNKKGSKWLTMPEQMFRYRAATFWARAFAPGILMGLTTAEEAVEIDVTETTRVVVPTPAEEKPPATKGAAGLKAALKKAKKAEGPEPIAEEPTEEPTPDPRAVADAAWASSAKWLDARGYSLAQAASIRGRAGKLVDARKAPDLLAATEMIASDIDADGGGDDGMPS